MDIRSDPRRVSLSTAESRLLRPPRDHIEASFTSTCQSIRANKEICPFGCNKLLAPRTIDFHRLNGCRGKQDDAFADLSRKRSFTCGACYEEFITRETFFAHLNAEHAVEASIRSETFPDKYSFERFKHWLEAQGGAHFRQKSGAKDRPSGRGIFMMCNRSGLVHTTAATGEPDKDKLGSYRMGFTCTAFINGTIYQDGHVSIRYCGDHYGHDARVRMPQSVKNLIMHMQGQGTSNNMIIRYLQERFVPFGHTSIHAQRAAYVDLEELRAITPMFRKLSHIPYGKEEEWEQEFLETAGVSRDWAPPYAPRPAGWLPIKEFAEKMNWPQPLVFKAKLRNAAGEWLIFDDERGQYVLESAQNPRMKADDFIDDLELEFVQQKDREMREGEGGGEGEEMRMDGGGEERHDEEEEEVEVDVEEMSKQDETVHPTTSSPTAKKRRVEEREEGRDEAEGRMEEEEEEVDMEERMDGEDGLSNGAGLLHDSLSAASARPSAFLASSIIAELDMMKVLVKNEAEFLSEGELSACLKQARALRLSFEPAPRRGGGGQRDFSVPQLARPSRVLPSRGRTRAIQNYHRGGEMRSQYLSGSGGVGWAPASEVHLAAMNGGAHLAHPHPGGRGRASASMMMTVPHEVDAADEEMMTGGRGARIQYNARLWS